MEGRQDPVKEMEESFAMIRIEDEEDGGIVYEGEDETHADIDVRWCLVGRFLTESTIDFQAMQHKLAALWRTGRGMYVKELQPNRYIFQFYHEVDIKRVLDGSPWTFGRFHLVLERLKKGDNPRTVSLNNILLWVQIHDMDPGFMSLRVVQDIGNYIGKFVESDSNNFIGVWREYLRVRVLLSIEKPLKRRMKLRRSGGQWCWANFRYEGVPTFCFICGFIGHNEKFCEKLFDTPFKQIEKPYGVWMRAEPRRRNYTEGSKWLKQGKVIPAADRETEQVQKRDESHAKFPADKAMNTVNYGNDLGDNVTGNSTAVNENQGNNDKMVTISNLIFESGQEGREEVEGNVESDGLFILDSKRRRTMQPNDTVMYNEQGLRDGEMLDSQNQKNEFVANSAAQARLSL